MVPMIQRRIQLREHLEALMPPQDLAKALRGEAARSKRPQWDVVVLERTLRRAVEKARMQDERFKADGAHHGGPTAATTTTPPRSHLA